MRNHQTVKRVICLCLSVILLASSTTTAFAATGMKEAKRDLIAEIIASIDLTNKKVEKAVESHLDENMNAVLVDSEELLAATEGDVEKAISLISKVVSDTEEKLEAGSANSAEAYTLLTDIAKTQSAAQEVYETAEADLAIAKAGLEAAQEAYDEAVAISVDGKEEAAVQLEDAKNAVVEAEKVFAEANAKLVALEELLAYAASDVDAWKTEAQNSLAAAGAHLAESNAQLEAALQNLETENAEFVVSVEAFQAQSEVFAEAVTVLSEKVVAAQEKETALESLYAEYEAVLVTYEAAMAKFEAEHGVSNLTYEDAVAIMDALKDAVTEAQNDVKAAEVAVTEAQAVIDAAQANVDDTTAKIAVAQEELDAVSALIDTVKNGDETAQAAAVHNLAGLVIEAQLANGLTVVWNETEGQYGKSDNGFYVVLNANGTVAARYAYVLENGVVNIYNMKSGEVTNYVTYNGTEYVLNEENGQYSICVNGTDVEVLGNVASGYYVVETWTEDRADTYAHQIVELTDLAPDALAVSYEGVDYNLASLTANADGTYSTEVASIVKLVVYKNVDATWSSNVYLKECTKDHTCSWKVWNCSFEYVLQDTVIPVTVSYPDKTQLLYNEAWYDLLTAEDGSLYIQVGEEKISIVAQKNILGMVESYNHPYTVDCSADVYLTYRAGGDADTFFELGTKVNANSDTLYQLKVSVLEGYKKDLANYEIALAEAIAAKTEADNELVVAKEALAVAETKYNNAVATFEELTAAYEAFEEKDLGALAALPKNFEEFITSANIDSVEDITALVNAIAVINDGNADVLKKLDAYKVLAQYIPMGDLVIPEDYENMNAWEYAKFLYEFATSDLGNALLDTASFQHEYLVAWLDALYAKIEVLQAGIVVVEEANNTITAGLESVYAGAELSDASIETMIEKIKTDVLSGTVAALTIAVDVVEVSDEMLMAINEEVVILRFEVEAAKAEVNEAVAELEAIQLQTPGGEALVAAQTRLDEATANYEALEEKLASLKESLADAEEYKAKAQAQYEALLEAEKPAVEEETVATTPVIYGYYSAPVVEEVVEAEVEEVENVATNNEFTINEEVVEIVEEETPLADGTTDIEEEEVPLASNKEEEEALSLVVTAVAGTATVAAAGGAGFVFFRKKKLF